MPLPVQVFNFQVSLSHCGYFKLAKKSNMEHHRYNWCNLNANWQSANYVSLANVTVYSLRTQI